MNYNFFTQQMKGQWFIQTTQYSLQKSCELVNKSKDQVNRNYINVNNKDLTQALTSLSKKDQLNSQYLHYIESSNQNINNKHYHTLLLNSNSKYAYILRYDYKFNLNHKFRLISCFENYIIMISKIKNFTIIEKIYFLHKNLRVTKSIIKQKCKCIGTSFSSEIKIS